MPDRSRREPAIQLRDLVGRLALAPAPTHQAAAHLGFARVAAELAWATPTQAAAFEQAALALRAPLALALETLGAGTADPVAARELEILARRVACVATRVVGPLDETGDLDELGVAYARVPLDAFLDALAAPFRPLALERGVRFEVEVPPLHLEADPGKLERIVLNLLFNAFKYAPPGGRVRLVALEADADVVVTVSDSGEGVPRGQLADLFDAGRHLERASGLRIGGRRGTLGSARERAELHGGSLDLAPGPDPTFVLRLPRLAPRGFPIAETAAPSGWAEATAATAAAELRAEAELEHRPAPDGTRPVAWIVEPNRSLQRILVDAIEPECATVSFLDPAAVFKRLGSLRLDLLVVDLSIGPAAEELVAALRRTSATADVPVLALAGREPRRLEALFAADVHDIVHKPFLTSEVRARARSLVRSKRACDLLNEVLGRHETDLVRVAAEVKRTQAELHRTLDDLRVARETAEVANRVKSHFLRIMSHEFKTPITAMQLHLRLLERDPEVRLSPRLGEGLERLGRSSRRLVYLVDTALEWARVESGRCRLALEPVDVGALAQEVADELGSFARQKQVELDVLRPVELAPIPSDRRLVRLLLANLLGRALHVTDRGKVEVAIGAEGDARHVSVSDGGTPIGPEDAARLFDPAHFAGDPHELRGEGSGLGLYVYRDIARAVGGDLAPTGVGRTLTLTLRPCPAPDREASPAAP